MYAHHKALKAAQGQWQTSLSGACCEAPSTCLCGAILPCIVAANQRLEILEIIREPYVCCAGMNPCLTSVCNPKCAYVEGCCCPTFAVLGNRYLIQTRFDRANTCCDDALIGCTAALELLSICLPRDNPIQHISQVVTCTVLACCLAQHHSELKYIRSVGYNGAPAYIMQLLPPQMAQGVVVMTPQQQTMGAPYQLAPQQAQMYGTPVVGQPVMAIPVNNQSVRYV